MNIYTKKKERIRFEESSTERTRSGTCASIELDDDDDDESASHRDLSRTDKNSLGRIYLRLEAEIARKG